MAMKLDKVVPLGLDRSPYINPLREHLEKLGYHTEIVSVEYELQPGGNEMLVIKKILS